MSDLLNKVAAITGGAQGIGKEIARKLGKLGNVVVICDIDKDKGSATTYELYQQGITTDYLYVDLRQCGAPQDMVRQVTRKWGRLDIIVNNARAGKPVSFMDETEDTWEERISVILKAAFFASQEAVRVMPRGGSIINIGSVSALGIGADSPVYHIAKAGLIQMTKYIAVYAGDKGIRANAVLPGFIVKDEHRERFDGYNNRQYRSIAEFCHPLKHIGNTRDVADAVAFLCSEEADFITGQCLVVDGGLTIQDQWNLAYRVDGR